MKTFGNTAHCIDNSSSCWTTEERSFCQKNSQNKERKAMGSNLAWEA